MTPDMKIPIFNSIYLMIIKKNKFQKKLILKN